MRQAARDAFIPFTQRLEGATAGHLGVPFMYLDIKGLVTTGIGNLIDTGDKNNPAAAKSPAMGLPWLRADGSRATPAEIAAEWDNIKSHTELTQAGGLAYGKLATLHLDDAGIQGLVMGKLASNESYLKSRFPAWDTWPADAQLAVLSMAWASGPAWNGPKFNAAANASPPDFKTAALESHFEDSNNAGLRPRNKANFVMLNNAAAILQQGLDPDILAYPNDLTGIPYPYGNVALPKFGPSVSTSPMAMARGAARAVESAAESGYAAVAGLSGKQKAAAVVAGVAGAGLLAWLLSRD